MEDKPKSHIALVDDIDTIKGLINTCVLALTSSDVECDNSKHISTTLFFTTLPLLEQLQKDIRELRGDQ